MKSLISYSLVLFLFLLPGCKERKKLHIETCVIDGSRHVLNCTMDGETLYEKTIEESDTYVATNPDDFEKLINYCKQGKIKDEELEDEDADLDSSN